MNKQPEEQPVAYDVEGRPLYYRPEEEAPAIEPVSEQPPNATSDLTIELQEKHNESIDMYPDLSLAPTEYVVIDVERSIWGPIIIWLVVCIAFITFIFSTIMMSQIMNNNMGTITIGLSITLVCILGGLVGNYVYNQSYFIVTNERVFARIQHSPFSQHSQNVELEHVEDCSYSQAGPVQMILGYGTIRLSTVGDEQTYRFTFVKDPTRQFQVINKVIQAVDEGESTKYRR